MNSLPVPDKGVLLVLGLGTGTRPLPPFTQHSLPLGLRIHREGETWSLPAWSSQPRGGHTQSQPTTPSNMWGRKEAPCPRGSGRRREVGSWPDTGVSSRAARSASGAQHPRVLLEMQTPFP